jgi:hypothetical protein
MLLLKTSGRGFVSTVLPSPVNPLKTMSIFAFENNVEELN